MKKVFLFLLVFIMTCGFAFSVDLMDYPAPLSSGNLLADVGLGWAFASSSGNSISASIKVPPIVLSAEYCLPSVPISIGILAGFYQYEWKYSEIVSPWIETWTYTTFGGRVNWHWNIGVSWFDLYTGAFVGYTYFSWSSGFNTNTDHIMQQRHEGIDFGGQVGAHFYFSKNVGAVAEWGYPFITKAGFALKF